MKLKKKEVYQKQKFQDNKEQRFYSKIFISVMSALQSGASAAFLT